MSDRAWLDQLGDRAGRDLAVIDHETEWTTDELLRQVQESAAWLEQVPGRAGSPVPAVLWSSPAALALTIAGMATRRPLAPLGPRLTPRELRACVGSIGGPLIVCEPATAAVTSGVAEQLGMDVALVGTAHRPRSAELAAPTGSDLALVLHTSGTGGTPRRVDVRHEQLAARTTVISQLLAVGPGDRYVTAKGLHHIGGLGLTLAALAAGAAVIPMPRFSTERWTALTSSAPTHGSVVPTMVEDLARSGALRLPSLRVLQYGGAPLHPETLRDLLTACPDLDVVSLYGQTEGSPLASLSPDDHRRALERSPSLLSSAGRAVPGIELRIENGEVLARGSHLFRVSEDGWLHTGDLGDLDQEGYLFLQGRAGDVIVRGGENVHPLEIERVLLSHPDVADVAVAGIDDRRLGQTVGAWIVATGGEISTAELRAWVREHLAGYKVPAIWTFVGEIPRTANGKIARSDLSHGLSTDVR